MPQNNQHIDQYLTDLSMQYTNDEYVAEQLAPAVMVQKESDKIPVYDKGMMFTVFDSLRADKAEANEVDWDLATPVRYQVEEYALADLVSDRERSNADTPLQPDVDTLEFLQNNISLGKEIRVAAALRNASNYSASNVQALSGTSLWDNYSGSSHPLDDIKNGQAAVFRSSRKRPNKIEIPYEVALTLSRHPDILELVKYTTNILNVNNEIILPASLFGMSVVIGSAGYNTSRKGQPVSIADVWGTDVIIGYVDSAPKLKSVSLAKTFRVERYVKKWREEKRSGDMIEVSDLNTEMIIAPDCGFLLQTVIST
ncbi:hypothetical protein ACOALA_04070 [Alicyclobacillus acidoterrestris]|uniref:hypothetical protein n=1 Tax=Alicyclobacillus acidoterrestris TaxID=1450 RepID=UPI003F52A7FB